MPAGHVSARLAGVFWLTGTDDTDLGNRRTATLMRSAGFRVVGALALITFVTVMGLAGCGDDSPPTGSGDSHPTVGAPPETVGQLPPAGVVAELEGRSFRQFHPTRDGTPRSGVILDFTDGFNLWAQVAEDGYAVHEWEITAADLRVESTAEPSEFVLFPEGLTSERQFPEPCQDCISTAEVSISVRDIADPNKIAFRINDPEGVLPSPFPLFHDWTRFNEDEAFH